jgi:lysophospholipase L1-like esterase
MTHPVRPEDHAEATIEAGAARRIAYVALTLGLMIASTYAIPPLYPLQPWKRAEAYVPFWNILGRELLGEGDETAREQAKLEQLKESLLPEGEAPPRQGDQRKPSQGHPAERRIATFPAYEPLPDEDEAVEVPIENAQALEHYYRRLTLVDLAAPRVVARALHWGDSLLGDDGMTFAIRSRLQARFGDGGHGFHVLAPFNAFHYRRGVRLKIIEPWTRRCAVLFGCEADGRYGLGGVSAQGTAGAHSHFSTAGGDLGGAISRFELWYRRAPSGGVFQVKIDGKEARAINTDAPEAIDEIAVFDLPDGPHEIDVRVTERAARGYGVVLERSGPGVVWDNLAVIGSFTKSLDFQDPEHIKGQIRRRDADLLVFTFGGNDVQRELSDLRSHYESEYARVIRKYRAGKPEASCLVTSITDHAEHTQYRDVQTRKSVPELVAMQRRAALSEGCAFYDLFRAMGGSGSAARWGYSKPALVSADFSHPTSAGHVLLATLFYRALMHGYVELRRRLAGQPFQEWEERLGEAHPRATTDLTAAPTEEASGEQASPAAVPLRP